METIPQDITETVRTAANTARVYPGTLADVHRRARRRRDRHIVFSAAAVVAVLAVVGFGTVARQQRMEPAVTPATELITPPEPRLILNGASGNYQTADGSIVELAGGTIGEMQPGGDVVTHPVVGAETWLYTVALPEGGLVALGFAAGTGPDQFELALVVTDESGTMRIRRDVRREGEAVSLVTATATTAYLWRPAGMFAHDLATGAEKLVVAAAALGVARIPDAGTSAADVSGDLLAVARGEDCVIGIRDMAGGAERTRLSLPDERCRWVTALRLSPDRSMIAVAYQADGPLFGTAVFRIADGKIMGRGAGVAVEPSAGAAVPPALQGQDPLVALAWQFSDTVIGVSYQAGSPQVHVLNEFRINW